MFKFFSYSICTIFFSISCFSQTIWKSDGSIIVDGQIKRESYAVRFLKQLKKILDQKIVEKNQLIYLNKSQKNHWSHVRLFYK